MVAAAAAVSASNAGAGGAVGAVLLLLLSSRSLPPRAGAVAVVTWALPRVDRGSGVGVGGGWCQLSGAAFACGRERLPALLPDQALISSRARVR
eukprot:243826-Chlamydomonas_euryale.AAC.5